MGVRLIRINTADAGSSWGASVGVTKCVKHRQWVNECFELAEHLWAMFVAKGLSYAFGSVRQWTVKFGRDAVQSMLYLGMGAGKWAKA